MAMKDYSEEFRADAVALYESTPGATYKGIAADLGITRATLRAWVLAGDERRGVDPGLPARGATGRHGRDRVPRRCSDDPRRRGSGSLKHGSAELEASERQAGDRARHPAQGREVFRGRDELVSRFKFVDDHRDAYEREAAVPGAGASTGRATTSGSTAPRPGLRANGRPGPRRADPRGARRVRRRLRLARGDRGAARERQAGQRQTGCPRHAHTLHRRHTPAPQGAHHRRDPAAHPVPDLFRPGLHRRRARPRSTWATSPTCPWQTGSSELPRVS